MRMNSMPKKLLTVPIALGALLLAGCSSSESASDPAPSASVVQDVPSDQPVTDPEVDKYEQTWTTPYDQTPCGDYTLGMTEKERWVAAADMLLASRSDAGISDELPPDAMVDEFKASLALACSANEDVELAVAGAAVFSGEPEFSAAG
ncbi:MAG: hypothetical protein Q7K25_06445 [Actinomycetota bacterium]|nr:hypothetical protein [Actinomycetota bacterium]